jgi:hypothetical protein
MIFHSTNNLRKEKKKTEKKRRKRIKEGIKEIQ